MANFSPRASRLRNDHPETKVLNAIGLANELQVQHSECVCYALKTFSSGEGRRGRLL